MKRLRRILFNTLTAISLILALATAALWGRSYRVLDQWYGRLGSCNLDAYSFSGRLQIRLFWWYRSLPGTESGPNLLDAKDPFASLVPDPTLPGPSFITRQRWPLENTSFGEPEIIFFPGVAFDARLAWPRAGPGSFRWVRSAQIPYWCPFLVFTMFPLTRLLPVRRGQAGHCPACGYDIRANPSRCSECGDATGAEKQVME